MTTPTPPKARARASSTITAALTLSLASAAFAAKPIVLIETDLGGDKDDQASFCRLLLHANELDIRAIVCDRPSDQFDDGSEWSPSTSITNGVQMANYYLDAYDQVDENLRLHDSNYPTAATLKGVVYAGYPGNNAGRDRLISVIDALAAGEVAYYSNWGSNVRESTSSSTTNQSALDRAFVKVLADRGQSGLDTFVAKVRQISLDGNSNRHGYLNIRSGQSATVRAKSMHVETGWPVDSQNYRWYHRFQTITSTAGGFSQSEDISDTHGALAPLYRGAGQKEGDSWSTLYALSASMGLSDLAQPTWGGLAGRYVPRTTENTDVRGVPFYWNDTTDTWNGSTSRDNTASRFAAAAQNAFRARWDWAYMTFAQANHDPVPTATLNGGNSVTTGVRRLSLAAGTAVNLAATVTDPDSGDSHVYSWTYYKEAGTYTGNVSITNASTANASFTVPSDAADKQIHVILAVTDNGSRKANRVPDLTRYCRYVIDVTASGTTPTAPAAPTAASAAALGSSSVEFSFTDASNNETAFNLAFKRSADSTWTSVDSEAAASGTGTVFEVTFDELSADTPYDFRAQAVNGTLTSDWVSASATTQPAPTGDLTITALALSTGTSAVLDSSFASGDLTFTDRTYTWSSAPSALAGKPWIRLPNNEKNNTAATNYLSFNVNVGVTVYVLYDNRATALPTWLSGFTLTSDTVTVSGDVGRKVYSKTYAAGTITLGGNLASPAAGVGSGYSVVVAATNTPPPANTAPTISAQPEATQTKNVGESVTFSVTASGTPTPTFQWRKDGTNISGATSSSYTISSVQTGDAGTYTVVVTNSVDSVTSTGSVLTVNTPPPTTDTTLDMESLTGGANTLASGSYTLKGFNGSGVADNLSIFGTSNGYASKVLHPNNYSGRITLERTDGAAFTLVSFGYAEGRYGDNGDVIVTATKADGTTLTTAQLSFTNKTLTTSTLPSTWTNLTKVTFNWAGSGSTNTAYGVIDNVVVR